MKRFWSKCWAGGGGGDAGPQPMSTPVHRCPDQLWRSNSILNLWSTFSCIILAVTLCRYLKPFLLECPGRDVRSNFSALLEKTFAAHHTHSQKEKCRHTQSVFILFIIGSVFKRSMKYGRCKESLVLHPLPPTFRPPPASRLNLCKKFSINWVPGIKHDLWSYRSLRLG